MYFYVSRTIRWYVTAEVTFTRESIQVPMFLTFFGRCASFTTNLTLHIIMLYQDSHSMRVSNLPNMN